MPDIRAHEKVHEAVWFPWDIDVQAPHAVVEVTRETATRQNRFSPCSAPSLTHSDVAPNAWQQVLGEQLGRRGDAVAPLRPMLNRTVADVRTRLVFRADTFIKVLLLSDRLISCGWRWWLWWPDVMSPAKPV